MNPVNLFMQDNELKNQGIYMFATIFLQQKYHLFPY